MKYIVAGLMLLTLSACGGGRAAPQLYTITATTPVVKGCANGPSIKLFEPQVAPGLESPRIVVVDRPQHQTFYNGVRWNAPAGRMLQNALVDAFERSGMFSLVTTDDSGTRTDWLVETQLRDFQVDKSGVSPKVVVRLTASLIRANNRQVVMSLPLESSADVSGRNIEGIIDTFNSQMGLITQEMLVRFRTRTGCR